MKPFDELTPQDLCKHAVWEFCNDLEAPLGDETWVRPVNHLPVDNLHNRVVGTELRFANGELMDGILSNVDLSDHIMTEHFVTLTIYRTDGKKFHLARYHDVHADTLGPVACAAFFGLDVAEVFPIAYNIESVAVGVPASVRRSIHVVPQRCLSGEELMRMALL